MIRDIIHNETFLRRPSVPATRRDRRVAEDLLDTLKAHAVDCAGLAANMIGVSKCVIAVRIGSRALAMLNPEILHHAPTAYEAEEGCLSLSGTRKALRYKWIEVRYRDEKFRPQQERFTGFPAQTIQHEIDHTKGILI